MVEYWLLSFGVGFGDFEMILDDEILGIFMEICDEVLMVFYHVFLALWFSVQTLFTLCSCFMSHPYLSCSFVRD